MDADHLLRSAHARARGPARLGSTGLICWQWVCACSRMMEMVRGARLPKTPFPLSARTPVFRGVIKRASGTYVMPVFHSTTRRAPYQGARGGPSRCGNHPLRVHTHTVVELSYWVSEGAQRPSSNQACGL